VVSLVKYGGVLFFGEKVNTQGFLGIGITALGVWLVIRKTN